MPSPGEDVQAWNTTAASNGNSDLLINWAEGQPRASVNNSARSMMAAHAKDRNLHNGSIVTTGTVNAQAFASGLGYTTVPTGLRVTLKIGAALTNTGAVTLNTDTLGAVAVKDVFGAELPAGVFAAGSYVDLIYDGTVWVLLRSALTSSTTVIHNLISSQVASNSSSLEFTGLDTAGYDELLFVVSGLACTPPAQLCARIKFVGAGDYEPANYWWAFDHMSSHSNVINNATDGSALLGGGYLSAYFLSGPYDAVTWHVCDGEIRMWRPGDATSYKHLTWHTSVVNSMDLYGSIQTVGGGCNVAGLAAIEAIKFFASTGVVIKGAIHLIGASKPA